MKTYSVTIRACITKTITVEAEDLDKAVWFAHDKFSVSNDDIEEDYQQDTLDVQEII